MLTVVDTKNRDPEVEKAFETWYRSTQGGEVETLFKAIAREAWHAAVRWRNPPDAGSKA